VALTVVVLVAVGLTTGLPQSGALPTFDVRNFGAAGNRVQNDTPAIDAAIAAANGTGGGVVEVPPGTYLAGSSIHMLSNVTLQLDAGATVLGASSGYDPPEPNPYAQYQGAGHSYFHNAMIWGEDLHNIAFVGSGTIDGGGNLITGNLVPGRADKIISLVRCEGLTISGITLERGGHFAIHLNDCRDVSSNGLTILTAGDRDGWDLVSSQDVQITNLTDHAYDDALAFKSDYALGETLPSGDVVVRDARLSSVCCNALMFGSETCGNFTNYRFSHIVITGAGKSGLGMVSMDGGRISDVVYSDVTMSGVAGPLMEKVGDRRSCGGTPEVGSISGIRYEKVRGTSVGTYSPTLWGMPGHAITGVTFDRVDLTLPGRTTPTPTAVPANDPVLYNPDSIGPRPAYGLYVHDAAGITVSDSRLGLSSRDSRPAVVLNDTRGVTLAGLRITGNPDVLLQNTTALHVTRSHSSNGKPLRIRRN
jgi:hypothetical protein